MKNELEDEELETLLRQLCYGGIVQSSELLGI